LDLLDTNYGSWCEKYIKEESRDKKEGFIEFIYKVISELQVQFNDLETKKHRLSKYYKKCNNQAQKNLKRMKSTYGNKLDYIINTKDDVMAELEKISQRLDDLERLISNNTMTEEIYERLGYCNKSVDGLYDKLFETEENLINAMDTMQITLENELGLHEMK
jgi:DNA repair ATPase RecN